MSDVTQLFAFLCLLFQDKKKEMENIIAAHLTSYVLLSSPHLSLVVEEIFFKVIPTVFRDSPLSFLKAKT